MDREISKSERNRTRLRQWLKWGVGMAVAIVAVAVGTLALRSSVNRKDIKIAKVDRGMIEASVTASGKVVPAFEEIITSPINTRIVEVYRKTGDAVEEGTPLLRLDLMTAQSDYNKLLDEGQMMRYQLEQLRLNNNTYLSDIAMKVKVKEMSVSRMEVELRNERYLDSLGSGTGDNVHQVELAYNTGLLELQQLRQQLDNEREVKAADLKVKQLELNIFEKNLAEMRRTLDDAQIRAPRRAVLTYINNQTGAQVSQGEQVAIISDLSRFKVDCEISDNYGDKVRVGGAAAVKVGREMLRGIISNVTPMSRNGVIAFSVQLDSADHKNLRSGLKTDVYVMSNVMENVLRLPNATFYTGANVYDLFVVAGDGNLEKRRVSLGDSNYDYVEVIDGLDEGDEVVISDMSNYKTINNLKLK